MRAAIAQHDWSCTPLGASEHWPDTLQTVLGFVLDTAFPMLIMWGPDLIQVYNDGYVPIFGDKHPRSLGQPAQECWADIWGEVGPLLRGVYDNAEAVFFENLPLMMQRHGGYEQAFFTFSYSPIRDNNVVRGIICVVNETTAHVLRERETAERAEALAQINRAKTQFFNNVSHEFRTPLTLMLGPLDDLLRTLSDQGQRHSVELARKNALRLLKLVNTLLEFARLQAGRNDAAYTQTDLAAFTRDLCGLFRSAIEKAGLRFSIDTALTEPVYVDRSMWEKIVLNLLSNALKFTFRGEISVLLRSCPTAAELVVRDTGSGIPGADLPHIFERFQQVRETKSRSHEGSGIGLALVEELVRLHGGSVVVESELGRGSAFTVRIPFGIRHLDSTKIVPAEPCVSFAAAEQYLADIDATLDHGDRHANAPAASTGGRARILVVDDNRDLREYVQHILTPVHELALARNGEEALAAARSQPFDLIISDIMMPEMNGFELLHAIRNDKRLHSTPIILLSARAGEESAVEGLEHGANDYLVKPFAADELRARVNAQLDAVSREARLSSDLAFQRWFDAPSDSRTNEIAFRTFADELPIMVFQHDVSGAVSFTNAAWYTITRLPHHPSSHSLGAWQRIVHPEDISRVIDAMSAAIGSRVSYEFEYRLKPADSGEDSYRWYLARAVPQYADGEFKGWLGWIVDIHDARLRQDAERALREMASKGEREFQALAQAIPVMVWTAEASGWIDWYNDRWFEFTGQTAEEAAGWGWQAAHHPEDLPRVMQEWPRCIASGEPFESEFRLRRADGSFHTVLARATPVRDESGTIVRWYGSNADIQVQKESLERSQRLTETLQGVFLPDELPHTSRLRVEAVYQAAEKGTLIGGDWFDALQLPDGRYLLSIGDVVGHGLDALVIAGRLRQAIVDFSFEHKDPAAVLERVNGVLRHQHPEIYATAIVGFIDRALSNFSYAVAGHPPPLIAYERTKPADELAYGGIPLGVDDRVGCVSHNVEIRPEAVVALYTDGITEFARDIAGAEQTLRVAVARLVGDTKVARPATLVRDAVLGGAATVDDSVLLVAQFSEVTSETLSFDSTSLEKIWRFHSSDANTANRSRRELVRFLRRYATDPGAIFTAELILGEILANTVEHAPGLVEVRIDWTGEKPIVTVLDTGPGLDQLRAELPLEVLSERGRGLFLIKALAEDVSLTRACGNGTELRAVLPLTRSLED